MPKGTTSRVRSRKINFKTRIQVVSGSLDHSDDLNGTGSQHAPDVDHESEAPAKVETGVDKEEEAEHHLQIAISASTASLNRTGSTSKAAAAYIPTPDAAGTVANYASLYPSKAFTEPKGYIRFSDTLEDANTSSYTMDEEDDEWLKGWNSQFTSAGPTTNGAGGGVGGAQDQEKPTPRRNGSTAHVNGTSDPGGGRGGRTSPRKGKEPALAPISEDDFEAVMGALEGSCDAVSPLLHLNPENIPSLADLEAKFVEVSSVVRPLAKVIYPHWKERRADRGGNSIIPQLDIKAIAPQSEDGGEVSPYICFRRREAKTVRKTRRNDVQNIERLARLRADLANAKDLLQKVVERERYKAEAYNTEFSIFEERCSLRDLKRKAGEEAGDEELLIGKKEKRKDRREGKDGHGAGIKLSLRKTTGPIAATSLSISEQYAHYREIQSVIASRVDRDLARKRDADQGWEDFTDIAYLPLPPSSAAKHWRAPEFYPIVNDADGTNERQHVRYFPPQYPAHSGGARDTYRRRVGRGGRIVLDRVRTRAATAQLREEAEGEDPDSDAALQWSRWKYDSDVTQDFPLTEPLIVDDFATPSSAARLGLLKGSDYDFLEVDPHHLDQATQYAVREPDKPPPCQFTGKLTARPPVTAGPFQGPGAVAAFPHGPAGVQSAVAGQMVAAATHAQQLAAAQASMRQASMKGASIQAPALNRTPSNSAAGIPQATNPAAWAGMNGYLAALSGIPQAQAGNPAAFPAMQNALFQQFPAAAMQAGFPNGVGLTRAAAGQVMGLPMVSQAAANGVNGLPAVSRLAAAGGFQAPMQTAMGMQQMRPQSQNSDQHGSPALMTNSPAMAAGAIPSSRPGSSASAAANHSPAMGQAQIPGQVQQGTPSMRKRSMAPGQLNIGIANQQFVNQHAGVNGANGAFIQQYQQQQQQQQQQAAHQQQQQR